MPKSNGTIALEAHSGGLRGVGSPETLSAPAVEATVRSETAGPERMGGHQGPSAGSAGHSVPPPANPQARFQTAAKPGFSFPLTQHQVELTIKALARQRSSDESEFFQLSSIAWGSGDGSASVSFPLLPFQVEVAVKKRALELMASRGILIPTVDAADFIQRSRVVWGSDGGATVTIEV